MIICVAAFTKQGRETAEKINACLPEFLFFYREPEETLDHFVGKCFERRLPLLFVGACGIAVRGIAPYVRDKRYDSPVLVVEEKGQFVIPILSGHLGGANRLAEKIAQAMDAAAVITTATDVNHLFSVDRFAAEQGFWIADKKGIKEVSAKVLAGETVSIAIDPAIEFEENSLPKELSLVPFDAKKADILLVTEKNAVSDTDSCTIRLVAKEYVIGVGCKKGKEYEALKSYWEEEIPYSLERQVAAIASIDLKKTELGLWGVAQYYHIPFFTFSVDELQQAKGEFLASEFVRQTTGVDNVCERAAVYGAGNEENSLVIRKQSRDGMTFAVAKRRVRLAPDAFY